MLGLSLRAGVFNPVCVSVSAPGSGSFCRLKSHDKVWPAVTGVVTGAARTSRVVKDHVRTMVAHNFEGLNR